MKLWYNPTFIAIIAIIILSIPALFSLSKPGFYTSHDGETHTARIAQYYIALKDGQYPPRFASTFYNGLGSPIFVYIYPLPYLLGTIFHFSGFSFVDSFKLLMALGFIFSGIFSYLMLKEITKSTKAAFVGSIFYIWSPYRLSLIYVRGSLSEHLAYTFLPLVFFAFTKYANTKKYIWIPTAAIGTSLLLLSQNLVALISVPLIAIYVIFLAIKIKSAKYFILSSLAGVWGFAISAFVYFPSIFEIDLIKLHQIIRTAYADHFVYFKQLIYSPWGYGFDLPGVINDQLSLQIGLAHLFVFALFTILVCYLLAIKFMKMNIPRYLHELKSSEIILALIFISIILFLIILMLYTPITKTIWSIFNIENFIDIPWRLTGLVIFLLSVITAYFVKMTKASLFIFILILMVFVANRNNLRINESVHHDDNFFLKYSDSATQYNEFTPKWRQANRNPIGFDLDRKIQIIEGDAVVNKTTSKSNQLTADIDVKSTTSKILLNKFYFPNTLVVVNKRRLELDKDYFISDSKNLRLDTEQDTSGLILLPLEHGKQTISMKYSETNLRVIANLLSIGALIVAFGLITINVKK